MEDRRRTEVALHLRITFSHQRSVHHARVQSCAGTGMGWQGRGQDARTEKVGDAGEGQSKAAYVRCPGADGAADSAEECGLVQAHTSVQHRRQRAHTQSFSSLF